MNTDRSVVVMSNPRIMPPFTGEARRPFRMTPDPWASLDVAYVGQDPYDSKAGCSQKTSSSTFTSRYSQHQQHMAAPSEEVDVQVGHDPPPGWPTRPPIGAVGDTTRSLSVTGVSQNSKTRSSRVSHPPQQVVPVPIMGVGAVSTVGWTTQSVPGLGHPRGKPCQIEGCPIPPSYSLDGSRPAFVCEIHRRDGMKIVLHDEATRAKEGCEGGAGVHHMSANIKTDLSGWDHKMQEVVPTATTHCEYPDCTKTPKYGHKDGPLSFCQSHKRAGMYTNRNGNLLVATRDGSAFRQSSSSAAATAANISSSTGVPEAAGQSEGVDSGAPEAMGTTSSPALKLAPLYRKLCEVAGCPVQPSYGPQGTSRPRFCAGHKTKDMIGLKNRPCLFPGCITRPHYGLSRGRPMYCTSHKKSGMVHLLKESMTIAKERVVRKRAEARRAAAEKKGVTLSTYGPDKYEEVGEGFDEDDENQKMEEMGRWGGYMLKLAVRGQEKKSTGGSTAPGAREPVALSSVSSSSLGPESASSPRNKETPIKTPSDTEEAAHSPRPSRLADTSGMTPSAEFKLLQEARESARAEAEASGSGRRPRAPSRKLLEASGRLKYEGAQWMTKEIKEAEATKLRELKEKRKRYKAAGLKAGQVVEECSILTVGTGNVGLGASVNIGGGGVGNASVGGGVSDNNSWRQLTTTEILQQVRGQPVSARSSSNRHQNGVQSTSISGYGPGSHAQGEGEDAIISASLLAAYGSTKKRKDPEPDADNALRGTDAIDGVNTKRAKTCRQAREHKDDHHMQVKLAMQAKKGSGAHLMRGADGVSGTDCEFAGCPKTAKFGVNGAVRYCAKHRLFGMHEIADNK